MTKQIIDILKIIGIIIVFVLTFGLINRFNKNEQSEMIDKEIEKSNNKIEEQEKKIEEINKEEIKVKTEIKTNKKKIEKLEEERENIKVQDKDVEQSYKNIKDFINE